MSYNNATIGARKDRPRSARGKLIPTTTGALGFQDVKGGPRAALEYLTIPRLEFQLVVRAMRGRCCFNDYCIFGVPKGGSRKARGGVISLAIAHLELQRGPARRAQRGRSPFQR